MTPKGRAQNILETRQKTGNTDMFKERIDILEREADNPTLFQNEIYEGFRQQAKFYERVASLHSSLPLEDMGRQLFKILGEVINISTLELVKWSATDRAFVTAAAYSDQPPASELKCNKNLINWSLKNKTVSLVPSDDPRCLQSGINGVFILPLIGSEGKLGALLLWGNYTLETSSWLVMHMLNFVAKDISGVFENIILRRRSRNIAELMDGIIECVPQAIMAVDMDNRILACNRNAEFMFDFKRVFALDEHYTEVLPEKLIPVFSSLIMSTISGKHEIDYETEYPLADGTVLMIGISTSLLYNREGNAMGVLLICRDLSLSREVQKLRELDQMKDEFVHTVSHELKTPLTSILGCSETLLEIRHELSDDFAEILDILVDSAEHLKELIADLLDMSRLQTGRMVLEKTPCDLRHGVDEIIGMLENNKNDCTLVVNIPEDMPPIDADYDKLKRVFQNFIGNAVKYSPAGGEVRIDIETAGDMAVIKISDHGLGMPKDQLPFIFDKFFRVDSSTTASIEGTGLGLSIAKHIIELHGGTVDVVSTLGKGSTFTIKLPVQ